jgi:branched-chain amino acid transport system permease protein
MLLNVVLAGLSLAALYFILSAGLSLVFGIMGVLNFASAGYFVIGVYATWYGLGSGWGILPALLFAALVGGAAAWLVEAALLRPLYGNVGGQILTTLGVMLILGEAVSWIFGPQIQQEPMHGVLAGTIQLGGMPFPIYRLLLIAAGAVIFLLLFGVMRYTAIGLKVRAGVESRTLAELSGVRVEPLRSLVYAAGGVLAGLAGGLYGPFSGVYPTAGVDTLLLTFIVVVIGGLGSVPGTLAASLVIGLAEALVGFYAPNLALTVNVLAMIVILVLRPQGLLGKPPGRRDTHAA